MNDWAHPKAGFASEMNDNGMECHVHFWPPHQNPFISNANSGFKSTL
jgi:hypothetical protein